MEVIERTAKIQTWWRWTRSIGDIERLLEFMRNIKQGVRSSVGVGSRPDVCRFPLRMREVGSWVTSAIHRLMLLATIVHNWSNPRLTSFRDTFSSV
jgi:hypothetical protein